MNKKQSMLLLSLIILISFTISIIMTVNNYNNQLHKIEIRHQQEQAFTDSQNSIVEADRILRESGN